MCVPAVPLMAMSAALTAGSGLFGGIAKSNQDAYSAAIAGQNANLVNQQAKVVQAQGVDDQTQLYRKVGQTIGGQVAGFAAAGLDPTFGSAAQTIAGTATMGEEDAQRQRNNTINQVNGYMVNAASYQAQRAADQDAASNDIFSGVLTSAGGIIGGASQIAKFSAGLSDSGVSLKTLSSVK